MLPRELRDEIYSHVCSEGSAFQFNYGRLARGGRCKWQGSGLPMLQVSRPIREEFMIVLFSKGVFKVTHTPWYDWIQLGDFPFMDDISNIEFFLCLPLEFRGFEELLSATKVQAVPFFSETSKIRNVCIVKLNYCGPTALSMLLSSPIIHNLSQLTGFKTVQLKFYSRPRQWSQKGSAQSQSEEAIRGLGTCPAFDTLVLQISCALEKALGSFTITCEKRPYIESETWKQCVTFHPQGHLIKKVTQLEE